MNYGTGIGTGSLLAGGVGMASGSVVLLVVSAAMLVAAVIMVARRLPRKSANQRQ